MKSLKKSLFEYDNTQTMESLFDKDLVQKDIFSISKLFDFLQDNVGKKCSMSDWEDLLKKIDICTENKKKFTIAYDYQVYDMFKNKLYIYVDLDIHVLVLAGIGEGSQPYILYFNLDIHKILRGMDFDIGTIRDIFGNIKFSVFDLTSEKVNFKNFTDNLKYRIHI